MHFKWRYLNHNIHSFLSFLCYSTQASTNLWSKSKRSHCVMVSFQQMTRSPKTNGQQVGSPWHSLHAKDVLWNALGPRREANISGDLPIRDLWHNCLRGANFMVSQHAAALQQLRPFVHSAYWLSRISAEDLPISLTKIFLMQEARDWHQDLLHAKHVHCEFQSTFLLLI